MRWLRWKYRVWRMQGVVFRLAHGRDEVLFALACQQLDRLIDQRP
jgi:hypothetical protein